MGESVLKQGYVQLFENPGLQQQGEPNRLSQTD
jgi:hypothetical protein